VSETDLKSIEFKGKLKSERVTLRLVFACGGLCGEEEESVQAESGETDTMRNKPLRGGGRQGGIRLIQRRLQ
jgi:hypothetical protein